MCASSDVFLVLRCRLWWGGIVEQAEGATGGALGYAVAAAEPGPIWDFEGVGEEVENAVAKIVAGLAEGVYFSSFAIEEGWQGLWFLICLCYTNVEGSVQTSVISI